MDGIPQKEYLLREEEIRYMKDKPGLVLSLNKYCKKHYCAKHKSVHFCAKCDKLLN
jgi:hypothetical protein